MSKMLSKAGQALATKTDMRSVKNALNILLLNALSQEVTAIQINPGVQEIYMIHPSRGRLDVSPLQTSDMCQCIINRLKIMARLDLEPVSTTKTGKIELAVMSRPLYINITVSPSADCEVAAIRLSRIKEDLQ